VKPSDPSTGERDQREHPGPVLPLYLAGARVLEVVPVLPLVGKVALGVGALSYAGTFKQQAKLLVARA